MHKLVTEGNFFFLGLKDPNYKMKLTRMISGSIKSAMFFPFQISGMTSYFSSGLCRSHVSVFAKIQTTLYLNLRSNKSTILFLRKWENILNHTASLFISVMCIAYGCIHRIKCVHRIIVNSAFSMTWAFDAMTIKSPVVPL